MKICTKCKTEKSLSEFSKNGSGLRSHCKPCIADYKRANADVIRVRQKAWMTANAEYVATKKKTYRQENKEKIKAYKEAYNAENKEVIAERRRKYNELNKEKNKQYAASRYPDRKEYYAMQSKKWSAENKGRRAALNAKKRAANRHGRAKAESERKLTKVRAMPGWADLDAIAEIYVLARREHGMHVDHIVPLKSSLVCGLHCEANLRIIPASENISKGNRHWPDMPG